MDYSALGARMEASVVEDNSEVYEIKFRVKRRWYHRRDVRFIIVVAALVGLYQGYGYLSAPDRMTPELRQALDSGAKRINIKITTEFPPEEFHMGIYQDAGSIRGTEGATTTVYRVKQNEVRDLARYYWIKRISLATSKK